MTFGFRPLESKTNQSSMNSSNAGFEGCYRVLHIFLDGSAAVCQQRAPIGSHMLLKDSLIMATTPLICRCSVRASPRRPNSDWVQFKSISYFEHSWHFLNSGHLLLLEVSLLTKSSFQNTVCTLGVLCAYFGNVTLVFVHSASVRSTTALAHVLAICPCRKHLTHPFKDPTDYLSNTDFPNSEALILLVIE